MINVVLEPAVEVSKLQYPVIMKRKRDGLIVLFYRDSYGTVLSLGESDAILGVGESFVSWTMDNFEKFDGIVKLSNEQF